jgi:signal transduction histidine kinase
MCLELHRLRDQSHPFARYFLCALGDGFTQVLSRDDRVNELGIERCRGSPKGGESDDRRKDEFLSMLAHELRNPLAPIRNVAQVLASGRLNADAVHRTGELLVRQTGQLARLLDDLLDAARITRGVIHLQKETLLLERVVDRAIETGNPC